MSAVGAPRKASVFQRPNDNTDEVHAYSRAWPCLFPQHGPGKKHLREIRLVAWQRLSTDIKRIFCDACDLLGVQWPSDEWSAKTISVARCQSVERLDEFIGPKR